MMNASAAPTAQPAPTTTITSLTSKNNNNSGTTTTTTSMSEALAKSVGDIICDKNKHNPQKRGSAKITPTSPSSNNTAAENTNGGRVKNSQICVVSAEHSNNGKSTQQSSTSSNNMSSMSSAVADLASGMPNFTPTSSNTNNNTNNSSAPIIISGTAAAVLALQSPFSNNSSVENVNNSSSQIIVSNSSSSATTWNDNVESSSSGGENRGGESNNNNNNSSSSAATVPNPLLQGAAVSSPSNSPTETQSDYPLLSSSNSISSQHSPLTRTRYADGGPIIAGTAAAQMEAIATATAARITSITTDGEGGGDEVINAVASLGSPEKGGVVVQSSHGFNVGENNNYNNKQHNNNDSSRYWDHHGNGVKTSISMRSGGNTLFSVDHGRKGGNDDDEIMSDLPPQTPKGGMDILAELTCHALPMALPGQQQQPSSSSSTQHYYNSSYPQHHQTTASSSLSIPSYQEIYQDQGSHQNHHQAQHNHAQHHDATMSPDGTKRVSGIPSYQEIYREMGLSPQQSTSPEQRRRHNHHHTNNSSYSYSVEEVSIDGSHRYNNVYHHHHQQQNIPPTSTPHRTTTHFGHVPQQHRSSNDDDLLEEGKEIYTRKDICVLGGHCSEVKEVHGNMREGCDSLVIGSLEKDIREADGLLWFLYSTDRTNGGGALCQSYHKKRPVRVFRSSLLGNKYAPPYFDVEDDLEEDSDVAYRYDGLYMVRAVWDIHGRETESHPVAGENGWQTFFCIRIPKKPLEKEKWEEGMQYNTVGCQELWSSIQKMRGVRKPKKFEIPTPPVKLLTLNKCAISGRYKDRKCPGYVKPDVVEVPPPVETTKKSNNNNRSVSGTKRRRKGQQHREEESDESDENETNQADEDESDSDSSERHQSSSPASSKRSSSPAKVMTPRPRLNSVSQKKASVSTNDDDDADSSDSETSTSANNTSMNKKRARSPSRKVLLNNNLDVSAYFPKRASAAKAEAANRHMFGSRSYKRKSSESAASSSTTTAAKAKSTKQQKPLRGAGGRKRIKVVPQDDDEFSSSSEEPNPDLIDHSILTVGSRVLVMYKDSFFKATIRKRREKDGKHDFLIHYDGNKKTNVHWITVDKISKILEINVDTPPKKKQIEPVKKVGKKVGGAKKRGNNGGGRRKALAKQTSIDSHESAGSSGKPPALSRQQSLQRSHYPDEDDGSNDGKVPVNDAHDSDEAENDEKPSRKVLTKAEGEPKSEPQAYADQKKRRAPESKSEVRDDGEEEESSDSEPDEPPKRKPSNIKTTTVATAASRKPRKTVVSEVCIAKERKPSAKKTKTKDPLLTLAEEAASDDDSDESSTNSSDKNKREALAESESAEEFKYPVGGHVYVEYRHILYSSNILKAKRKRSVTEYLVHYEGYKKSSNRWVKEKDVHEVNAAMTRRYEEQRLIPADILHESELPDFSITTRRKKATDSETQSLDNTNRSAATARKKPPPRRMRSDASDVALEALASGVSFLAGSMVFVEWSGALYLAKMVKKRYSGDRMEYLISYDGYKSSHDAWVSINKIYEVNPQTKRVFKRINADISGGAAGDGKPKRRVPPGRRETRKKAQDDEAASSSSRNSEYNKPLSRASSHASSQSSRKAPPRTSSTIDMKGIEPGVEFLPGSTLFAEYKSGLCLAKMLKKRGKDDYMEYFIQYHGLKKTEEAWVSTSMVYEINPQTKRMHRLLSEKK